MNKATETIEIIRAEIERLIVKHEIEYTTAGYVMNELLSFLDTLQEPEVDLEKELDAWRHNHLTKLKS